MTTIAKWGNSFGVRLPKRILEQLRLGEGSAVEVSAKNGHIVVTPSRQKYCLEQLLENVNKNNLHKEVDVGDGIGKEEF